MQRFFSRAQQLLQAPFVAYNELLVKYPVTTKCVTSGVLYAAGDVLAQYTETYNRNKLVWQYNETVAATSIMNRVASRDALDQPEAGTRDGSGSGTTLVGKESLLEEEDTILNVSRVLVFFLFGTVVGGPMYHYWFNYLNELPALLWKLKKSQQRTKILRAYAYLKSFNIEVKLDLAKLPKSAPLGKWEGKIAKILADQLIFSSVYTFLFFFLIGVAKDTAQNLEHKYFNWQAHRAFEKDHAHDLLKASVSQPPASQSSASQLASTSAITSTGTVASTGTGTGAGTTLDETASHECDMLQLSSSTILATTKTLQHSQEGLYQQHLHREQRIEEVIEKLKRHIDNITGEEESQEATVINDLFAHLTELQRLNSTLDAAFLSTATELSAEQTTPTPSGPRPRDALPIKPAAAIVSDSLQHLKEVYWTTYFADCIVWPPLQLINFTFVPLRFQFLYVNVANLAWNTFLSLMANKSH